MLTCALRETPIFVGKVEISFLNCFGLISFDFRSIVNINHICFWIVSPFDVNLFLWDIIVTCWNGSVVNVLEAPCLEFVLHGVSSVILSPDCCIIFWFWQLGPISRWTSISWWAGWHLRHRSIRCCIDLHWLLTHISIIYLLSILLHRTRASLWRAYSLLPWRWFLNDIHLLSNISRNCWLILWNRKMSPLGRLRYVLVTIASPEGVFYPWPLRLDTFMAHVVWHWYVRRNLYDRVIIIVRLLGVGLVLGYGLILDFVIIQVLSHTEHRLWLWWHFLYFI